MMGTRAGSVDPGIIVHLATAGLSPDELGDGLAHRSGLLAIGGTSDVRELEERASGGDEAARLALAMFAHRAAAGIAAVATSLERLDAIVFTGGIGEHSAAMRQAIVERLATLRVPARLASAVADDRVLADGPPRCSRCARARISSSRRRPSRRCGPCRRPTPLRSRRDDECPADQDVRP